MQFLVKLLPCVTYLLVWHYPFTCNPGSSSQFSLWGAIVTEHSLWDHIVHIITMPITFNWAGLLWLDFLCGNMKAWPFTNYPPLCCCIIIVIIDSGFFPQPQRCSPLHETGVTYWAFSTTPLHGIFACPGLLCLLSKVADKLLCGCIITRERVG